MIPRHVSTSIFILFLVVHFPTFATDIERLGESWRWVRFGNESGLPSERVEYMLETHTNELWVRTSPGGVAYFDGYRWNHVQIRGLEHTDLTELAFVEDSVGILVLHSGNVYHLDRDTSYRIPMVYRGDTLKARSGAWLNGSHMFMGDSTFFMFVHGSVAPVASPYDTIPRRTEAKYITNRLLQTRKSILFQAGSFIYRYVDGEWKPQFRSPTDYLRLYDGEENDAGDGLAVIKTGAARMELHLWRREGSPHQIQGEEGDPIRSFDVSPDGDMLILLKSGNLRAGDRNHFRAIPSFPSPVISPLQVRFRKNGDLWVCTERGLFLCRLTSERWSRWGTGAVGRGTMVNSIEQADDGSFWFGTADGICVRSPQGLNRYIRKIGEKTLGSVTTIQKDAGGNIWIGSGSTFRGSYRWDGRTWRWFGAADGLAGRYGVAPLVHKIVLTRSKQLWFCGMKIATDTSDENPGAFLYQSGKFQKVCRDDGLLDNRVYTVTEDRRGALWFGTYRGLSRWYHGSWTTWKNDTTFEGNHSLYTLAVDSANNLWMGRRHGGLICLDTTGKFSRYTVEDGLVGNSVWDLQVDSLGLVWIATYEGVACYDGSRWMSFDVHTGLPNSEVWPILVKDRRVYIGTQGAGVAVLSLDHLNDQPHKVTLDTPLVEDKRVTLGWAVNAYWADVSATQIETRYKVDGSGWSSWSTGRNAVFKGLDAGTYKFYVEPRQTSHQGVPEVMSVTFTIPPPLYLRPIVALPIVVLGLLVLALAAAVWDRKRRLDQSIRDSEARLRAQYKSNPIPTFTWKYEAGEFSLVSINDAALVVFARGQEVDWVGRPASRLLGDKPEILAMIERSFKEHSLLHEEFHYAFTTSAREADLSVTYSYVPPDMVLTHVEDVTDRKRSEARIRESREQLRALASRLESVREEERTQLSREIHDELGQLMTGLKMDLAWIRKRSGDPGESGGGPMQERIHQMNSLLDQSIQTVRKIAGQLRPALLDELGLVAAMDWQSREWQNRTGISCNYDALTDELHLPREKATELFRIFQELLTNIARHAGATEVTVVLYEADEELCLEVRDNGKGIREEEINRPVSLGILGMKERTARVDGRIVFTGEPGKGTNVRVSIPMKGVTL
jgi:signal transduction histidine kinase/ligand-binding sensor domain-containing protein